MDYTCDVNTITDYLENVSDREYWHLCKISTKQEFSKPIGKCGSDLDELVDWITRSNANRCNIYEQVNPPKRGKARKATRDGVRWLTAYHVDWDIPAALIKAGDDNAIDDWLAAAERKLNGLAKAGKPHLIMTGNGLQARWPLPAPIRATPDAKAAVEDINARIAHTLGADSCHNCDRLLRVPGTWNHPTKKKRADGYVPVMAELWHTSTDEFLAEDFAHLKPAPMKMKIVGGEDRIDWTLEDYTAGYEPVDMAELLAEDPIIHRQAAEHYAKSGDRSSAIYTWLKDCIRAFCHIMDCEAQDLLDDDDIYINISRLIVETDAEWLSHYDNQPDGLRKLGMDLQTAIYHACDEPTNTPGTRARADSHRLQERALVAEHDTLSPLEHRRLFIEHIRSILEKDDLPNVVKTAGHVPSARQSATESNLREIFDRAGIVARWNVMKDEPAYDMLERCGKPQAGDSPEEAERRVTAPRFHFQRALAGVAPDMARAAQESLISDAVHELGLVARRDMERLFEIMAKDRRFHPIEDYCRARVWDGRDRIKELAGTLDSTHPLKNTYLNIFFRQGVAAKWSLDAYLRGDSGEMLGSVVILVGPQGVGKTTFWRSLIPPEMKSDGEVLKPGGMKEADNKRDLLSGLVAVCDEIGAGLDYSQQEDIKNFMTATCDTFRVAYAQWPTRKPRMTQIVGTSNELHLKDHTGSRRWLAMDVSAIDWQRLNGLLDEPGFLQQCYAQAWADVEDGAIWWLTGKQDDTRARFNAAYEEQTPEVMELEGYLDRAVGAKYYGEWLNINQIFRVLNLKYTAVRARHARNYLHERGVDFKGDHKDGQGRRLRSVFCFPVTLDMLHKIDGG